MRVGIIASSDRDLYASVLLTKLVQDGNAPVCIFCAEEPKSAQIRNYLRANGLTATVRKILDSLGLKATLTHRPREYLEKYSDNQGLNFSESVRDASGMHEIPFLRVPSMNDPVALALVQSQELDVLLTTGGEILRKPIIESVPIGVLNVHSAILPQYRGFNVMEWSILCGAPVGVSLHFIDVGIDTGDISIFREVPVEVGDNIERLRGKFFPEMVEAMSHGVRQLAAGSLERRKQAPEDGRQYFAMHPKLKSVVEQILAQRSESHRGSGAAA